VIGGGRSGRWHRLGGKLVVAENNDYRLNAGGRREFICTARSYSARGSRFHCSAPLSAARVGPIRTPTVSDRVHTGRLKFNRENIERDGNFYFSYKKRSANEREEAPRAAEV